MFFRRSSSCPACAATKPEEYVGVFFMNSRATKKNFDSNDGPQQASLPNFRVDEPSEDHTSGHSAGGFTPRAMVANADWAVGTTGERMTNTRIGRNPVNLHDEDDARNGTRSCGIALNHWAFCLSPYKPSRALSIPHPTRRFGRCLRKTIRVALARPLPPDDAV